MSGDLTTPPAPNKGRRPLEGWRVMVTRARSRSAELAGLLSSAGALAIELPSIEIADPGDGGVSLREALSKIEDFDWVVFTSVSAVERCFDDPGARPGIGRVKVAAIGPSTARALTERGVGSDLVPDRYVAEALVEAFPVSPKARPGAVLLPCAAGARDTVAKGLRAKGWKLEVVEAYRTIRPIKAADTTAALETADIVIFASSSAVTGCLELLGTEHVPPIVACIGPVTARTAAEAGLKVEVVARVHTAQGLVQALVDWAAGKVPPTDQG